MSDRVFVGSNILIYAHDLEAGDKHGTAADLVRSLWERRSGVLSTQVLQEFYVNVTKKIPHPLDRSTARDIARNHSLWRTEVIEPADVFRASEIEETSRINFWDALIVAAAAKSGAATLLSEDLTDGQTIAGVLIQNPLGR